MTKPERKSFMLDKLRSAMSAIQSDSKYDWTRQNEAIYEAAEALLKAVHRFIDGKIDEQEVKPFYRAYVGLYVR